MFILKKFIPIGRFSSTDPLTRPGRPRQSHLYRISLRTLFEEQNLLIKANYDTENE
jgi:hypothetical protein